VTKVNTVAPPPFILVKSDAAEADAQPAFVQPAQLSFATLKADQRECIAWMVSPQEGRISGILGGYTIYFDMVSLRVLTAYATDYLADETGLEEMYMVQRTSTLLPIFATTFSTIAVTYRKHSETLQASQCCQAVYHKVIDTLLELLSTSRYFSRHIKIFGLFTETLVTSDVSRTCRSHPAKTACACRGQRSSNTIR